MMIFRHMFSRYIFSARNFSSVLVYIAGLTAFINLCSASTPLWQADRALSEGDLDTAQAGYQAVLEKDPGNLTAHYNAGLSAYMTKDYETAEQLFTTFTQQPGLQDQQKIEGFFNRGDCHLHLKKYQDAIDAYTTVLALDPNHNEAVKRKQIAEELLKEQQRQEQEQKQQQEQKDQQDQQQQDQDQNQQDTDQQQQNGQGQQDQQQDKQQNQDQDQRQDRDQDRTQDQKQTQDQQKQQEPQNQDQQKDQEQEQKEKQQQRNKQKDTQQKEQEKQDEHEEQKAPEPQDKKNARQTKKPPQQKPEKAQKQQDKQREDLQGDKKKEEQKTTGKTERKPAKKQPEKKAGAPAKKSAAEKAKEALATRLTPAEQNLLDAVEEEEGKLYKAWLKSGLERADTEPEDREHAKNW